MQTHRSFLEDIIDESVDLLALEPEAFDHILGHGWRLLGFSMIRHNFAACRGRICSTIPLRIRLDADLNFSKSQRRLLRRNAHLKVQKGPIEITAEKERLFHLHTSRFRDGQPLSIFSFLNPAAHEVPVTGQEYAIFDGPNLIACSFFHLGETALSATYCFFDPTYDRYSLGTYTMLLELQLAKEMGKKYYYHGYCYDVPSQFDYKLNFNNLESMDWKSGKWTAHPRVPVRQWDGLIEK